ncbi:MAG: hypothetical protein ABIO85_02465 [Sphingomicrobium sp.]
MATFFPPADEFRLARMVSTVDRATWVFWAAAGAILGGCATHAANGHWLNQPNRDLFQHTAVLRVLIDDIYHPANPYVADNEGSRHFHPYWVAMAFLARSFGWTVRQTIGVGGFLTLGTLATGIFQFGRRYFRSNWGPFALLVTLTLGWSLPLSHTGFLSIPTLAEGAAYPAVLLSGLSLISWAIIIDTLEFQKTGWLLVPLVAIMFATHQLGAGLGLIVGTSMILLWPGVVWPRRGWLLLLLAGGLLLSTVWPYHNSFDVLRRAGNPTWKGSPDFFLPYYLVAIFVPALIGIVGLRRPIVAGTGRPLLLALALCIGAFVACEFGFLTGMRFAPMAATLLQIGLASTLVRILNDPSGASDRVKLTTVSVIFGFILFQLLMLVLFYYPKERRDEDRFGDVQAAAAYLTKDLPPNEIIAAYDVASWPVVAAGHRVVSIPWPEPMIVDLAERQRMTEQMFDPLLSKLHRQALFRQAKVRVMILDLRFGPNGHWTMQSLGPLIAQAHSFRRSGSLVRFDVISDEK